MRLAVSNIAWLPEEDDEVHRLLVQRGVDAIEIAPTRLWPDPADVPAAEAQTVAAGFRDQGLDPYSFQSLLFARPDLVLFGDEGVRDALVDYLGRVTGLAAAMGVQRQVFGSPKSRAVPKDMSDEEAFDIAVRFFRLVGDTAAANGTMVCIEPNPPAYACNFVTTADEGAALVQAVGSQGFGLHLDAAGLVLAGQDPAEAAESFGPLVRHVHASAPQLGVLEREQVDHDRFASALEKVDYQGVVSVEMRSGAAGENVARVDAALELARAAYGA